MRGSLFPLSLSVLATLMSQPAWAFTFLGPTPYLSAADSPFDPSVPGSTFFFEDFEDGDWDLPSGVVVGGVAINSPGDFTDSVDADDGMIDGSGAAGHSMEPNIRIFLPTNPVTYQSVFEIVIDLDQLGFVPNSFGFVWTDGVPGSELLVLALTRDNTLLARQYYDAPMDPQHNGETSRDVFVGFTSDVPFERIYVHNSYRSNTRMDHFEIDHIQFGRIVPEPASSVLLVTGVLLLARHRKVAPFRSSCNVEIGHEELHRVSAASTCF